MSEIEDKIKKLELKDGDILVFEKSLKKDAVFFLDSNARHAIKTGIKLPNVKVIFVEDINKITVKEEPK